MSSYNTCRQNEKPLMITLNPMIFLHLFVKRMKSDSEDYLGVSSLIYNILLSEDSPQANIGWGYDNIEYECFTSIGRC